MVGLDGLLVARGGLLGLALLGEQDAEVDRRGGGLGDQRLPQSSQRV